MRNIIFTSAICIFAGQAFAQAPITQGCFLRDYSDAHLASHPKQVVDWIRVKIHKDQYDQTVADVDAYIANQGHALASGLGGQVLAGALHCWQSGGDIGCSVDCDGGTFYVIKDDGQTLTLRTEGVMIGDTESCGGALSLAEEVGKPTTYRLNRVADDVCEGN